MIRAAAWIAVVLSGWSLTLPWGIDAYAGGGAPGHLERHVVGTLLLALGVALTLSISGRGERNPGTRWRIVATLLGAGAVVVTVWLRQIAADGQSHLLEGRGFWWLATGAGMALFAGLATLPLPATRSGKSERKSTRGKKRRPRKR